jgi:hypothetical protein
MCRRKGTRIFGVGSEIEGFFFAMKKDEGKRKENIS